MEKMEDFKMEKLVLGIEDFNMAVDAVTQEQRLIRKEIAVTNKAKPIYVYEPTEEDYNEIKTLMTENVDYKFNTEEIFNVLIYRFTNLDMTGLDEVTRQMIIQSPPLYLRKVLLEIQVIISDIVDTYFCEMRSQVSELKATMVMTDVSNELSSIDMNAFKGKMKIASDIVEKGKNMISDEEYNEMKKIASQYGL